MSLSRLVPCPGCARHVRASESACPFCRAPMDAVPEAPPRVLQRMTRAAILAFSTLGSTLGLAACDGLTPPPPPGVTPPSPPSPPAVPTPQPAPVAHLPPTPPSVAPPKPDPHGGLQVPGLHDPGAPVARYGAPGLPIL